MLLFVYRNRIAQISFHSATDVLTPELNDNQFHSYYSAIPVQPFDDEQSPTRQTHVNKETMTQSYRPHLPELYTIHIQVLSLSLLF